MNPLIAYNPKIKPRLGAKLDPHDPINRGLIGHWLFNEGAGNLVQDARRPRWVGTIVNARWTPGLFGPCVSFDGSGDYIDLGPSPFASSLTQFSISLWVKSDAGFSNAILLEDGPNYLDNTFYLYGSNARKLTFSISNGWSYNAITSLYELVPGWNHVVCVFHGGRQSELWQNGLKQNGPTSGELINYARAATTNLFAGMRPGGTLYYTGEMDNVAIFDRALSPSEITRLYRDPWAGIQRSRIEIWSAAASGGAGGTAYTRTFSDGIGIADAQAKASTFSRSFTESVGSTDALGNASAMIRQIAESLSIADARIKAEYKTLADLMGIVDATINVWQASRTMTDTVGLSDDTVEISVIVRTLADTLGVTDDLGRIWTAVRSIADGLGISDAMSPLFSGAGNYVVTFADTIGTGDSISTAATLLRIMAENLGLSDGVTTLLVASRLVSDSLGVTDGLVLDRVMTVADSVGVSDDITRLVQYLRTQSDTQGILDAMARVVAASRTIDDSVGMTDAMSRQFGDLAKAVCAFILLKRRR